MVQSCIANISPKIRTSRFCIDEQTPVPMPWDGSLKWILFEVHIHGKNLAISLEIAEAADLLAQGNHGFGAKAVVFLLPLRDSVIIENNIIVKGVSHHDEKIWLAQSFDLNAEMLVRQGVICATARRLPLVSSGGNFYLFTIDSI